MGFYMLAVVPGAQKPAVRHVTFDGTEYPVRTITYKDVSVVAAEAPVKIYEPNRKNAKAHQDTVAAVMKDCTVIPVSFGNVVESEADVKEFASQLYGKFKQIFPKIEGKMEVGLKLTGKKEWMKEQAMKNPALKKMQQQLNSRSRPSTYYENLAAGEASKKFVTSFHEEFEKEVFQPLAKIADAAKSNETINERMLLNAAFLLDAEKEEAFDKEVNRIYEKWKDRIDFSYTGPWPAYNFIDLKVKAGSP
ncbi:GvpL/GvpF family gas vesicle protein [Bacillus daqingensis]|uniref:GvpL/GvpF family gas vesicle protein n=1 Tax=Bacillus daqingensis TaxID=872396 RepID=A0ABV9NPI5_9BACI